MSFRYRIKSIYKNQIEKRFKRIFINKITCKESDSNNNDVGLVITTFNRPEYLNRFLVDLKKSELSNISVIYIVDDGSDNNETLKLIEEFSLPGISVEKIYNEHQGFGVHKSLEAGWGSILDKYPDVKYLTNLDPDSKLNKKWLCYIRKIHIRESKKGNLISTGFNTRSHKIINEAKDFYSKKSLGGINLFFNKDVYFDVIQDNLIFDIEKRIGWDWFVIWKAEEKNYKFLSTKPSVIQHIGKKGISSDFNWGFDRSTDF